MTWNISFLHKLRKFIIFTNVYLYLLKTYCKIELSGNLKFFLFVYGFYCNVFTFVSIKMTFYSAIHVVFQLLLSTSVLPVWEKGQFPWRTSQSDLGGKKKKKKTDWPILAIFGNKGLPSNCWFIVWLDLERLRFQNWDSLLKFCLFLNWC